MKKLIGIGIGPGDPELLTMKAVRLISEAARVYAPKSKDDGHSLASHVCCLHFWCSHQKVKSWRFLTIW